MRLLKIEWLKLKKYRTFFILTSLFAVIFILVNLIMNMAPFNISIKGMGKISIFQDDYSFKHIWSTMGFYYGFALIFMCVFIIVNICNEIQFKTRRQHIIDGYTRLNFLHGKVALVLGTTIALTLLYLLFGLIMGYANGGGNVFHEIENIGYVFLLTLNYLSFSALLALLIKRSGLTIMAIMAVAFFEGVISGIFLIWKKIPVNAFLPLDSSDAFFSIPWNPMANQVKETLPSNSTVTMAIMSGLFIVTYYIIARWRMQKVDL